MMIQVLGQDSIMFFKSASGGIKKDISGDCY